MVVIGVVVFILEGPQFNLGPAEGPQCTLMVYDRQDRKQDIREQLDS